MTFKISLGMIVRNEGRTLNECLMSVAPHVDEIVLGLAGESTDDTEKIIQEFIDDGFPIRTIRIPWHDDFSEARNIVLEAVTGDYFLWIDGDDVLQGAEHLRELVTTNPNVDVFYMGYDYQRDEAGRCVCYLVRERLVRLHDQLPNRGWKWVGKVHEVLIPEIEVNGLQVTNVVVQHHKPANKHDPNRNLKILYQQLEEQEPNPDPRILGYLCTEQASRGNFKEAILHGNRFVQLSGWREEKYQMQHRIADLYRVQEDLHRSLNADMLAMQICPEWPDAWYGMADTYLQLKNYDAAIEMSLNGSTKESPQTMLIINPLDYTYSPAVVLAAAYAHKGDWEMALSNYEKAYEVKPSPQLLNQINILKSEVRLQNLVKSFLDLREHLGRNDEWLKVRRLFDAVPKHVEQHPLIMEAWERTMTQTAHIEKPEIMTETYTDNPYWTPMSEEIIWDPDWLKYPRLEFALDTAKRIGAKTLVDWGCSDGFITLPIAKELSIQATGFDLDPRCIDLATIRAEREGIQARFEVGNLEEIGGWEGPKADLGLMFEVIEHVVDPARTLEKLEKTSKHIAITTPFLAWEQGNIAAWDRVEPKGHLRIFDQFDLERILSPRGRIWNLYRQPWGNNGWLFADYTPGEKTDKTIIIGAFGAAETWNPRTFEAGGLGGSETAVLKLAESFVKLGHKVIVYTNTDEPGYYNGVCYRPEKHFRPEIESDMYIAWRNPVPADWAVNTKHLILWMHDTDIGDILTPERARRFERIFVLTRWHALHMMKKYPFLKEENFVVIGNGVDTSLFDGKVNREPKRVIYSSSPDRGLDVILEHIWPQVLEVVPDAELHIYYGWTSFDKFLNQMPGLVELKHKILNLLSNSKGVVQHGRVNQRELAQAFMKSSAWLYPTHFTETYCITAVEAQLGGAIPVTNDLAALAETVHSGIVLSQDVRNPEVQQEYAKSVINILMTPMKERRKLHKKVRENALAQTWDDVAMNWLQHLEM